MGNRWLRVLRWSVGAAIALFVLRELVRNWDAVRSQPLHWEFHPLLLAASVLLVWTLYGGLVESWRRLVAGWGRELPRRVAARIWILSSMGKYLPGKVWAIAGMAVMAQEEGVPAWAATSAAILNQVLSVGTGVAVIATTGLAAVEAEHPFARFGLMLLGGLSGLAVIAMLIPSVATRLLRLVAPRAAPVTAPPAGAILAGVLANLAAWCGYGVSLWLLARGTLPEVRLPLGQAIGAFAASYILGLIALFAPGGIGVREGVLFAMLRPQIGDANALALAAVSRLGLTIIEVGAAVPFALARKEKTPRDH